MLEKHINELLSDEMSSQCPFWGLSEIAEHQQRNTHLSSLGLTLRRSHLSTTTTTT
jgi:hypothetical protein